MFDSNPLYIDYKDLLCLVIKKIWIVIIVTIVFTFVGIGFTYYRNRVSDNEESSSIININVRLPNESEQAYLNRVNNVNRANIILGNISSLSNQVDIQSNYISNSLLMQIDPLNTACSAIQIVIVCDNDSVGGLESLFNAYNNDITRGSYLDPIAESIGCSRGALQELISCTLVTSQSSVVTDESSQLGTILVSVKGDTLDLTEEVMDAVIVEIEAQYSVFDNSVVHHTISILDRYSSVSYDSDVRETQFVSMSTLNTLQSQINNMNSSLDNIAKILGLKDRTSFYETDYSSNNSESFISMRLFLGYVLVGFVVGAILVAGYSTFVYVYGQKLLTQRQFFLITNGIRKIGVIKPIWKRSKWSVFLDKVSGDDIDMSSGTLNEIISANYINMTQGMDKVLITGTADELIVKDLLKTCSIRGEVQLDIFNNPSVLKTASEYDGIVIVEQRTKSIKKRIREEIDLLTESGTAIIGAIII